MDKDKFFKAVLQGKDEEVGEMLTANVDHNGSSYVTAKDDDGNTALHWAARQAFFRMARLLLNLGAPVNATNHAGQTPLHLASFMDRCQMGCLLIDHGADLWALDKDGRKPISKEVAATERLASTFVKHKNEQDAWAQQNEQLIAILGNKNRGKLETLLQDSHEKLSAEMEQQKTDIMESQEVALQALQATTNTLQGRMSDFEQQQQEELGTLTTVGGENQDPQVSALPPKKRRHKMIATETTATTSPRRSSRAADASSQLAICEAQLKEQAVEIATLRAMILGEATTEMATEAFASPVPTCSATTRTLKTSSSSITSSRPKPFCGSKVKMDEAKMAASSSDGTNTTTTTMSEKTTNKNAPGALLLLELESTKLELQRVQAELQTTKESENRYKCKCEYYKDRMEQLNKIIKFQP